MEQDNEIDSEMYEERARFLVNTDEIMMDTLGKRDEMSCKEIFHHEMIEDIEAARNIKIVDELFASREFRTFIEVTDPGQVSKRDIQPLSPRSSKDNDPLL